MILQAIIAGFALRSAAHRASLHEWGAFWVWLGLGLGLLVMAYDAFYAPCRL